jgi:hypothetical protein
MSLLYWPSTLTKKVVQMRAMVGSMRDLVSETIMESDFDKAFLTVKDSTTMGHLDPFDASQVMTADFDVWDMQTTE